MLDQISGHHNPAKLTDKIHHHMYFGGGSTINYEFNKFNEYLMTVYCVPETMLMLIHWNSTVNKQLILPSKDWQCSKQ